MNLTKKELIIVLILSLLTAIEALSMDLYLPAFSAIVESLQTDMGKVQITISVFLGGFAVGQLLWGAFSDRFGRKLPIIIGSVLYALASFAVLKITTIEGLWLCRFVQAFSGSAGVVVSRAVVSDTFDKTRTTGIFALLAIIMCIGPIISPMIGTALINQWYWQSTFTAMGLIGLLALISTLFFLPETHPESKRPKKSGTTHTGRTVWGSYLHVARNKQFMTYTLIGSLVYIALMLYITNSPLLIMEKGGFSEINYSLIFGFNALGMAIASVLVAKLSKRFSLQSLVKWTVVAELILTGGLLLIVALDLSVIYMLVLIFFFVFTLGILFPATTDLALQPFRNDSGTASALLGFLQLGITFIVTGLLGLIQEDSIIPMALGVFLCGFISWILVVKHEKNESIRFMTHSKHPKTEESDPTLGFEKVVNRRS